MDDRKPTREQQLAELYPDESARMTITIGGGDSDPLREFYPPRPKGSTPNRYAPHQGKREIERRMKRMGKGSEV